jgi:hypothetical protein
MNLEHQVAIIDALSQPEKDGLGNVCIGFDQGVPKEVLKSLQSKGLVVRTSDGRHDVVSYWVHFAWCQWCSQNCPGEIDDHD